MRVAKETLDIYAPLAERIGMQKIKSELEEIAFRELHKEAYESITARLNFLREQGSNLVPAIIKQLEKDMDEVYTDYMLHKDGTITVKNNGRSIKGKAKQSVGRAFPSSAGEMEVSFVWPYWWFRATYKILYVSADYSAALVAGEGENYLWMLTRDRIPTTKIMDKLREEALRRGFDTDKLRYTTHQKRKSTAPDTKRPG